MTELAIGLCIVTIATLLAYDFSRGFGEEIPEAEIVSRDAQRWERVMEETDLRRDDQRILKVYGVDTSGVEPGDVVRAWGGTAGVYALERDEH